jgi:hypothetical protein
LSETPRLLAFFRNTKMTNEHLFGMFFYVESP